MLESNRMLHDGQQSIPHGSGLRRLVKIMHRSLRDGEGNSNLMERFDELTKLLYCKISSEQQTTDRSDFFHIREEDNSSIIACRVRSWFDKLVQRNRVLFPERFAKICLADSTLYQLVETLAPLTLSSADDDVKGLAYEEIISNTFDKGDNQQFFTPRPLVEFMVQFLADALTGTICDPACGTGGFLLFAHQFLRQRRSRQHHRLLGFEIDERLAWVAGMNLDIHGVTAFEIRRPVGAGSLGSEVQPYFGQIDVILTNPPFGSDCNDREALADFELGRGRTSRRRGVLFVERCLDLLKPGGILAIIIDDSVLNGPSNKDTRQMLLYRAQPLALISLPETAFLPYASVKTSILVLCKKESCNSFQTSSDSVFFARAASIGRKANGEPLLRWNSITGQMEIDSDLPEILRTSQAGEQAYRAIAKLGDDRIFWARVPDVNDASFAKDGFRLDLTYHHPSRQHARLALQASSRPLKSLGEICDIRNEIVQPGRDLGDEEFIYLGLANIEAHTGVCSPSIVNGASLKSSIRRFMAGDILFARLRPELRKICLVPPSIAQGFVSAECLVLVPKKDPHTGRPLMTPELLALLLRSDLVYGQLIHLVIGIGRPRLSKTSILQVRLPDLPWEEQQHLLNIYDKSYRDAQQLRQDGERTVARSSQILVEAQQQLLQGVMRSHNPADRNGGSKQQRRGGV